jgi:hypothetical protein
MHEVSGDFCTGRVFYIAVYIDIFISKRISLYELKVWSYILYVHTLSIF